MHRFYRYELRARNVDDARAFYRSLLGAEPTIVALPDELAARGVVPHWLGHIEVDDVERSAMEFVEHGATKLGPTVQRDGGAVALLRDPGGATIALSRGLPASSLVPCWHNLNAAKAGAAMAAYGRAFDWIFTDETDLGSFGVHHSFACAAGEDAIGSMTDITGRPSVHPHWLFHFLVDSLEASSEVVHRAGGTVIGPIELYTGSRIAICEDPQGAAFALWQQRGSEEGQRGLGG
jgi:predicted enzyme related to lactoylglutathione lyase